MVIDLMKHKQMFSLTLPDRIKGRYWITDTDRNGSPRELISIEASEGSWVAKSNRKVSLLDDSGQPVKYVILRPHMLLKMVIQTGDKHNGQEYAFLYVESDDIHNRRFRKIVAKSPGVFSIGRSGENEFHFDNRYTSSRHAKITYDGTHWSILDLESTNGTYVNGFRIQSSHLDAGDVIFIMGLKIVVGRNFLAINEPDRALQIKSSNFVGYNPQRVSERDEVAQEEEKQYFFRAPRFHREIEHAEIVIDPPPGFQKLDTVPLALMLGPSVTMGMASLSTAMLSLTNVLSSGGSIMQAMRSLRSLQILRGKFMHMLWTMSATEAMMFIPRVLPLSFRRLMII